MRAYHYDFGIGKDFLGRTYKAIHKRNKKDALNCLKLRLDIKETLLSEKSGLILEKIFTISTAKKGLIIRIYKERLQISKKKPNNLILLIGKSHKQVFTGEDIQMDK